MFQRFISLIAAALLILASLPVAPAQAWFRHGAASGACPYPTDNGCAAANPNGSFQSASLLTASVQSGQNSLIPLHPMTFNIPGYDYPIGPDKTLTPRDPRTINDGICQYQIGSNPEVVLCFGTGVEIEVLDNYDFSGAKIGKGVVLLYAGDVPAAGSRLTITNSYFYIPAIDSKAIGFQGNWSIKFWNNQCDGSIATLSSQFCFGDDGDNAGTTFDAEYNVFTHQGVGRVAGGFRYMATTWKYNYIEGLNNLLTGNHGEVSLRTCSQNNCTGSEEYNGNFVVWDTTTDGSVNNATFFPSTGDSNGIRLSFLKIINNISVNNLDSHGGAQVGNGLFGLRAASYGDVTITGNWLDTAGGGNDCGISGATSGGNSVTASQSSNTVNVTGLSGSFGNNPIEPGWQFYRASGYTTTNITAFGTAFGNTGTYTVDGPSQAVGSDSNWTVVPGFSSQTLGGNYLLNDPGHTGVPTAIGYTGPQFAATNCF